MKTLEVIGHTGLLVLESLLSRIVPTEMINVLLLIAVLQLFHLARAATERITPRFFDLALLVTSTSMVCILLHVYVQTTHNLGSVA